MYILQVCRYPFISNSWRFNELLTNAFVGTATGPVLRPAFLPLEEGPRRIFPGTIHCRRIFVTQTVQGSPAHETPKSAGE